MAGVTEKSFMCQMFMCLFRPPFSVGLRGPVFGLEIFFSRIESAPHGLKRLIGVKTLCSIGGTCSGGLSRRGALCTYTLLGVSAGEGGVL